MEVQVSGWGQDAATRRHAESISAANRRRRSRGGRRRLHGGGLMNNWPESQQVPALERCGFPMAAVGAHGDPVGARRQSGVT